MKSFTYTIRDEYGIHGRPAGNLVKAAKAFQSALTIECGERKSDLKKLMALMALCIKQGETVLVTASGPDEDAAIAAIRGYLSENM